MAASALAAIKELLDNDEGVSAFVAADTFFQKAPDTTDLANGAVIVLDHRGEAWDRTTETRFRELTFGVLAYSNTFATLDQKIFPAIQQCLDDCEPFLRINGCDSYNLEILSVKLGLEAYQDAASNDVYSLDVEMKLNYQELRRGSEALAG